jgi:hypothetical protein
VTRRVRDHEGAPRGREEAVGDIDGDALLPLGLEAVDQEREIDVVAGGAMLGAVARERGQLILEDQLAVVQQPPDQRRLAVVPLIGAVRRRVALTWPSSPDKGASRCC